MTEKKNSKEKVQKEEGAQKHKKNILEMIGGMDAINQYIEGFSKNSEHELTEQQKQYMRHYATDFAGKWSETIYKMEQALKNPDVIDSLERKVQASERQQKNKTKE